MRSVFKYFLSFIDIPFINGDYSVAPLVNPGWIGDNETFILIKATVIDSDEGMFVV